jgi:hemoglobin
MLERYGGFPTLSRIVMDFYDRVIDSDVLGPYFEDVDMRRLVDHQTKFVAWLMGGPASYTDEALRRVHAHLAIDEGAFEVMISTFTETLSDHDVDDVDIDSIEKALRARRSVVVTNPR